MIGGRSEIWYDLILQLIWHSILVGCKGSVQEKSIAAPVP